MISQLLTMQDNDPSHSADITMNEFGKRNIIPICWPACAQDLNLVESFQNKKKNCTLQNYPDLGDEKQQSEDELGMIVKEAIDSVTAEQLIGLIRSMLARRRTTFGADWGYSQY